MITLFKAGILTVSDRSYRGEREDQSGVILKSLMDSLFQTDAEYGIVPDDKAIIEKILIDWADNAKLSLILTTGGTGLAPRDVTPEATREIIEKEIPGIPEALRAAGLLKKSAAMLSRAVAGVRGKCLIINMPGSPRAVEESFEVLRPVLKHAIDLLNGEVSDCQKSLSSHL